jgi:hypothetical protein
MTEEHIPDELTDEELENEHAEELPDREAMMVVRPPLPMEPLPPVYSIDPPPTADT